MWRQTLKSVVNVSVSRLTPSLRETTPLRISKNDAAVPSPITENSKRLNGSCRDIYHKNAPRHDKTYNVAVRPAKTLISLGIRPVWSESSLCAQWVAKGPSFLHADSEDSDQTGRIGCPGWSESSLGAHSLCWFCHETAQILKCFVAITLKFEQGGFIAE